jgi:multidrug efflux pump subunit AcrB
VFLGLVIFRMEFVVMMTMIGIISLAGVVVNNAIVLIDYADQLQVRGLPLKEALLRAGVTRLRPVLLTAITTILGLLPMALGVSIDFTLLFDTGRVHFDTNAQSGEWWGPMAEAVVFGLALATVLTLILVPVMYLLQERVKHRVFQWFRILQGLLQGVRKTT